MSSSVSNISFRYHPEDEQLEDNYDTSASISTTSIKSDSASEESSSSAEVPSTVLGRLGIREETDKWKLFREVKGRITKSVEDKLEEIKTERLKNQCNKRRSILGQMENSSISDSEEQSESSQPSASDKSTKSAPETLAQSVEPDQTDEKPESDASYSQGSTPERSTTPVPSPSDVADDEVDLLFKKGKGLKGVIKKKKGKTKLDSRGSVDKTTIAYSALCDNDTDSELVELAQEVLETAPEASETQLAKELDRIANPSWLKRLQRFLCDWHMLVLPVVAFLINWFIHLPEYVQGFMLGFIGLLLLQRFAGLVKAVLGSSEPPIKQLKDLLPFTGVPIFRRSVYDSDVADTQFEGWMNEYSREYRPETYHITLTETVYIRLEGSKLRLSTPRCKVPKRALWNEPHYKLQFNRERLYDIANCQVVLKPDRLIHRRIWSKKYPICIILSPTSKLGVKYREKSEETIDEDAPWINEKDNFDNVSEDSDEEMTVPVNVGLSKEEMQAEAKSSQQSIEETISIDSIHSADSESINLPVEDLEDDFVKVDQVTQQETLLYLFARTDREKEIWFRRLTRAAAGRGSPKSPKGSPKSKVSILDYLSFMLQLSQRTAAEIPHIRENNAKMNVNTADLSISMDMMWLNAFFGRVLYDVFQDPDKLVKIQEKIQRKLSAIKLPLFLEQLEVSHLDLGQTVPIIQRATRPTLNAQGVWVDLDIVYEGGFKMTIDTKLNLNRIKQMQPESPSSESPKSGSPAKAPTPTPQGEQSRKSAVYDSEVEDSAETSSEEPDMTRLQDTSSAPPAGPVIQHKYLRILDKVAQSKYFQQVVDYKFIKRFVAGNNLQLIVEVKGLLGTLVLNIPPPPSNRLWYGFRTNPKLWLSAQPKFGQHAVHVISRIIEKKLSLEFQRILVLPNMDDLLVPIMNYSIPS